MAAIGRKVIGAQKLTVPFYTVCYEHFKRLVAWLLAGDPAIRWQTLRDLQDAPPAAWQAEQRRTLQEGWGAQLLALQAPDGTLGRRHLFPKVDLDHLHPAHALRHRHSARPHARAACSRVGA